jgi:hypothetical protein
MAKYVGTGRGAGGIVSAGGGVKGGMTSVAVGG